MGILTEKISGLAVSPGGMVTSQIDTCITPQSRRVPELDDITSESERMKIKEKKFKDNLSKLERKALHELCHNNEIVIKQADKGETVVIMIKK